MLLEHAHAEGWATPETTVVIGGSSGGLTVLGILADRPDLVAGGIPPADVAERIFEALQSGRFTILPHPQFGPQIAARGERLVAGDLPVSWDI